MKIRQKKYIFGLVMVFVLGIMPLVVKAGSLQNPLVDPEKRQASLGIGVIVGRIVNGALGIAGVLATIFIILGGIKLMLGYMQGAEEKVNQGKKTLLFAIVGLIVAFGGYLIINTVIQSTGFLVGQETQAPAAGGGASSDDSTPTLPPPK